MPSNRHVKRALPLERGAAVRFTWSQFDIFNCRVDNRRSNKSGRRDQDGFPESVLIIIMPLIK
jgi:hypothetical protein